MSEFENPENDTKVGIFVHPEGFFQLVVRSYGEPTTYIISLDGRTGTPLFMGIPMLDTFPTLDIAMLHIAQSKSQPIVINGRGLIGMACLENTSVVGIVTETEQTAELPNEHKINTIRSVKYVRIPHDSDPTILEQFQLEDNHVYCESFDITRSFPSNAPVSNPDTNYVWNLRWIQPFKRLGLQKCCIVLVQGTALSFVNSIPVDFFSVTYLIRRAVTNPGTRYTARGLNDKNWPGNEVEADLIMCDSMGYSTVKWLRGSIPIRWKTTISAKIGAPKHQSIENFMDGTDLYFRMLNEKYEAVPILCVSMLNNKEGSSEYDLSQDFMRAVDNLTNHGITNVKVYPFNINDTLQEYGSIDSYREFAAHEAIIASNDFGFNNYDLEGNRIHRQNGLLRFNCADSLDRTNLATFFYAMKVTLEWCRIHGHGLKSIEIQNCQPADTLSKPLIDFLGQAFVLSGNVVSKLYTNTPAVKSHHIGAFSSAVTVDQSDTTLAVKRRIEYIFNDDHRDEIIHAWIDAVDRINQIYTVDLHHLFLLNSRDSLKEETIQHFDPFLAVGPMDFMLPYKAFVNKVSFVLHPFFNNKPMYLTISGGVDVEHMMEITSFLLPSFDEPTWIGYSLKDGFLWGTDDISYEPVQIVRLVFNDAGVFIQNISFELDFNIEKLTSPVFRNGDEGNIQMFRENIGAYLSIRSPTIVDRIDLERKRICLQLPSAFKQDGLGGNPWIMDSASQLIAASTSQCCVCHKMGSNENSGFYQSSIFRGLITTRPTGISVPVCQNCKSAIENVSSPTTVLESQFSHNNYVMKDLPIAQEYQSDAFCISRYGLMIIVNKHELNQLIDEHPRSMAFDGECILDVFLFASSFLTEIRVDSDSAELTLSLDDVQIPLGSIEGTTMSFNLAESINCLLHKRFKLDIQGSGQFTISKLQLFGKCMQMPVMIPPLPEIGMPRVVCDMLHPKKIADNTNRCVDRVFKMVTEICGVLTFAPNTQKNPVSLQLNFFAKKKFLSDKSIHIIIPRTESNVQLRFFFQPVKADHVRICFLDRQPQIKPNHYKIVHNYSSKI